MAGARYSARDITILDGLDPVRRRPGMYIGGTGKDGLHHLVREIVDNAVDEVIAGHATAISVRLSADGRTVTVTDNGRGIPVDIHPEAGRPALEVILTTLHAGAKFDNGSYKTSGGLHGVGSSVVNALSERLVATVRRDGAEWRQEFRRGRPRGKLKRLRAHRGHGTTIEFTPDPEIFGEETFEAERILEHLETAAYLHRGLTIAFKDEGSGEKREIRHDDGVRDYLAHEVAGLGVAPVGEGVFALERDDEMRIDLALCWTEHTRERTRSFVNGIPTRDGGTHEQGLRDAVVKAIRNYVETHDGAVPKRVRLTAEDIREGLVAVLSVFHPDPQFQGQTKDRFNNPEARALVDAAVRPTLEQWLHAHRSHADAILGRIVLAARARLASRAAGNEVRRKSAANRRLNLPGKLADCSVTDPTRAELFIVEGDSAGGSAKQGRDRRTQAILPLRGKVLNAERASLRTVLANHELSDIVKALGCGIGRDLDLSRLRYHKVILLMDADSDGNHIATLLLAFFYRYLKPLVDGGYVYLAQPPLYRIQAGSKTLWAADDAEKARILKRLPPRTRPEISRFKGLGEMMPRTLFETTLDPRRRRLLRVTIPDGTHVEADQVMRDLLGRDAAPRYRQILRHMEIVDSLDV